MCLISRVNTLTDVVQKSTVDGGCELSKVQLFVRCSHQADLLAYIKVAQQLFYWLDHVTKDFTGTFIATKLPVEVSYGALIGTFRLQNAVYGPR
jgi:hypothetical protein